MIEMFEESKTNYDSTGHLLTSQVATWEAAQRGQPPVTGQLVFSCGGEWLFWYDSG